MMDEKHTIIYDQRSAHHPLFFMIQIRHRQNDNENNPLCRNEEKMKITVQGTPENTKSILDLLEDQGISLPCNCHGANACGGKQYDFPLIL